MPNQVSVRPALSGYTGFQTEEKQIENNRALSPTKSMKRYEEFSRIPPLDGYTGHVPKTDKNIPRRSDKIVKIRGYSGFIQGGRHVFGSPIIPNEEQQLVRMETKAQLDEMRRSSTLNRSFSRTMTKSPPKAHAEEESDPDIDLQERYLNAMEHLFRRGQTPQMLLRTLQGKISERVTDYSTELIRVRKLFEAFDFTGRGHLDATAFRNCIELMGCQFDEIQSLALFSFFDDNNDGVVDWEELAQHVIMYHPGGGKLVPKQITATMFSEDWQSAGQKLYK